MLEQLNGADGQAEQHPNTTAPAESQVNEQPETTGGSQEQQPQNLLEIDGEKVSLEDVKKWKEGNMRHEDYTKKTMELAEERRKLARLLEGSESTPQAKSEVDPELDKALTVLKQAGVVTKEDLAIMKAQEQDKKNFDRLIKANPELKAHKSAIWDLGNAKGNEKLAWEDIVAKYGYKEKALIAKAKSSAPVVGAKSAPTKAEPKNVKDMTPTEWATWKKQNLKNSNYI